MCADNQGTGRHWTKRRRVVSVVVLVLLLALAGPVYSYTTSMLQPSSLPLTIRSIEWIRENNGAWLVNAVESYYYALIAPKPGGPALTSLPSVGLAGPQTASRVSGGAGLPQPIDSVIKPALPGEGVWRLTSNQIDASQSVLVSVFRPDPMYPRLLAYVAWIDTTRTQLALYAGRRDPPVASPRGPMEVPVSLRAGLLATFNSGYTYKDCRGGFAVNGRTFEPMVKGQGTIVYYRGGRCDVVSWTGGANVGSDVLLARQNLPPIVTNGRPDPSLAGAPGAALGNMGRVWRTALGVDAHGNLIYLAAPEETLPGLAAAIARAGAVRAMRLDMNAPFPSFITYAATGARFPSQLVPTHRQPATRYLMPDDRDFFAVYQAK